MKQTMKSGNLDEIIIGHDFDPVSAFCRRCGISETEFAMSQRIMKRKNRIGNVVEIVQFGGKPCLKADI